MTWHTWGPSPPHSAPPPPGYPPPPSSSDGPHHLNGYALPMMIGQLLERSAHQAAILLRIDARLERGEERFDRIEETQEEHAARMDKIDAERAAREAAEVVPRWEKIAKRVLTWAPPTLLAWASGVIDKLAAGLIAALK
jgi:hypothetical protein